MSTKNYDVIRVCKEIFPDSQKAIKEIDKAYLKTKNAFPDVCDELFDLFFNYQNRDVRYYPADSLRLIDVTSTITSRPYFLGNRAINNLPYLMMLNESIKFLKQHNYDLQDRNSFVTRVLGLAYDKTFLPYLVLFFIVRDKYSLFKPILMVEDGLIQLSFEVDSLFSSTNNFNFDEIKKKPIYRLLVDELKIVSEDSVLKVTVQHNIQTRSKSNYYDHLTTFSCELYQSSSRDFEDRIVKYLERVGPASRKTLAKYFEVSDRKMAYALSDLLDKNRITTSTESKFSPYTLYYINDYSVEDEEGALILNRVLSHLNNKRR